jgi:ADP-ribose pyrophosphatase YjhB (NUDIX family)
VLAVDADHCPLCGAATGTTVVEGRDRTYCPDCDRVLWRNAVPVVNVRVADGDRVLLVERGIDPYRGRWCLPGGHAEFDEAPAAAAARELAEETGLTVAPDALAVGDATLETFEDHTRVAVNYAVDRAATTGEVRAGTDAVDARFRRLDDVAEDELVPSHWGMIDRLG